MKQWKFSSDQNDYLQTGGTAPDLAIQFPSNKSLVQEEYEALLLEDVVPTTEVRVTNNITNHPDMLTDKELEDVTAVFRSLETGLRGATIDPQDLHKAMKRLGLNPSDQEMVDIPNRIAKNGLIYFPDFCKLVLDTFREERPVEEQFRRNMFKILCGTEPFPTDYRAKKYKLDRHFIEKVKLSLGHQSLAVLGRLRTNYEEPAGGGQRGGY